MSDCDADPCAICLTSLDHVGRLRCGHGYHLSCIVDWLLRADAKACPLCRTPCMDLPRLQMEIVVGIYEDLLEAKIAIEDPIHSRTKFLIENLNSSSIEAILKLIVIRMGKTPRSLFETIFGQRTSLQFIPAIQTKDQRLLCLEVPWSRYTLINQDALIAEYEPVVWETIKTICHRMRLLNRIVVEIEEVRTSLRFEINDLTEFIALPSKTDPSHHEPVFLKKICRSGEGKFIIQPVFQEVVHLGNRRFKLELVVTTGIVVMG